MTLDTKRNLSFRLAVVNLTYFDLKDNCVKLWVSLFQFEFTFTLLLALEFEFRISFFLIWTENQLRPHNQIQVFDKQWWVWRIFIFDFQVDCVRLIVSFSEFVSTFSKLLFFKFDWESSWYQVQTGDEIRAHNKN